MANRCVKRYLRQVKLLFPVFGKEEKKYFQMVRKQLQEVCDENHITQLEQLYENFGQPHEIVLNYFSDADYGLLVKRIRFNRARDIIIKTILIILCLILFRILVLKITILLARHIVKIKGYGTEVRWVYERI